VFVAVQPSVNRAQIRAIAIGWFIANGETVRFASAPALVARLARALGEGRLDERLLHFSKPKLPIVDELGHLPFEPDAARRYLPVGEPAP
jgi:DNA replication protein DnaC